MYRKTKNHGDVELFGHKFSIATTPEGGGYLLMDERFTEASAAAKGLQVTEDTFNHFMVDHGKGFGNPLRFPDAMCAKLQLVCLAGYAGTLAKLNT